MSADASSGLEILYILGARLRAKNKSRSPKKEKEERRGERERIEKREEESK